jgi:hypothetical protein
MTPPPTRPRYNPRRILITPETPDNIPTYTHLNVEEHNIEDITINDLSPAHLPLPVREVIQEDMPAALQLYHVAHILGYRLEEVAGDGNCMLHSIKQSLKHQPNTQHMNLEPSHLRRAIYSYMHTSTGSALCTRHGVTNNELHDILPTPHTNGDYLEYWAILALQHILNINITVYHLCVQKDRRLHLSKLTESTTIRTITVSIIHHNTNHYAGLYLYKPP